jgi:hypothetical protein
MIALCRHYACRCARADELARLAAAFGRNDLLLEATGIHEQSVRCRRVEPKEKPLPIQAAG